MSTAPESLQGHWDEIYATREVEETGWFEASPTISLSLVDRCGLAPGDHVLDAGAGASSLAAALFDRGIVDVTVLDISTNALDALRSRLGEERSGLVRFVCGDVTEADTVEQIPRVQLWHDRAMLHFLTSDADCARYAEAVNATVAPGGYAILATYALDGAPT